MAVGDEQIDRLSQAEQNFLNAMLIGAHKVLDRILRVRVKCNFELTFVETPENPPPAESPNV